MNVLLLNPTALTRKNYVIIPNVGLGFVATALRQAGHAVSIIDCALENIGPSDLATRLGAEQFDAVGLSLFSTMIAEAAEYFATLRRLYPQAVLVAGGPHPTFEPEDTLQRYAELDYCIMGEGEVGLPRLLDLLRENKIVTDEQLDRIPGIAFRRHDQVVKNPVSFLPEKDLTALPAWDLLQPHRFPLAPNGIFSKGKHVAPIMATRGCPYSCKFCGAGRSMGRLFRKRPIDQIIAEIKLLTGEYSVDEIHFMDDNFSLDPKYLTAFCQRLLDDNIVIPWACPNGLRIDSLDRDLIRLMENSGCYSMAVGIENGSDEILKSLNKQLSVAKIEKQLQLIARESQIRVTGFFIIGLPQETVQNVKNTIAFALRMPLHRANFFNFSPFPGSVLHDELKQSGKLDDIDVSQLYIHKIVYAPPAIGKRKLSSLQREAHFRFYSRPKIIFNILREIRSLSQLKILLNRIWAIIRVYK